LLVLPDLLLVSHSENWLTEDGGNRISLIDRETGSRRGQIEMALGHPAHACPDYPVPFVSPTPNPVVPFLAPDPGFGCWPNSEFLALGWGSDALIGMVSSAISKVWDKMLSRLHNRGGWG
jgi:hypothetical protein